jgi:short-subunit dehydrogenase
MTEPKHVLITGASSGIGEALALAYAAPGMRMALGGRDRARLDAVAAACRAKGADVSSAQIDVADAAATAAWIGGEDKIRPLDLVIANAGIAMSGTAAESMEQSKEIFAINIDGTVNTVYPALALMKPRRRGQVALVSSLASFRGFSRAPAYCASKAAVRLLGEGLRAALATSGVGVTVICPGFVRSRMTARNKFPMPLLMDAGRAAQIIKSGLAKNLPRIAFPWRLYAAITLLASLPAILTDRFDRTPLDKAAASG